MKMTSSTHLTSMSALPLRGPAVHEDGQHRADRHPGHLVPPEERDPEQLRAVAVVDPGEQHPQERHEQQPVEPTARLTLLHLSSSRKARFPRAPESYVTSSTTATPVPNATTSH